MHPRFEVGEGEIRQPFGNHPGGALQGFENGAFQGVCIARVHQHAQLSVSHRFPASIEFAGYHRHAAGHGLEQHKAESFAPARHDIGIGEAVVAGLFGFGHQAGKHHTIHKAEGADFLFQAASVGTIAYHQIRQVGVRAGQCRQDV